MLYDLSKYAADNSPSSSYALHGRLVRSKSGWLLLEIPNAIVTGLFYAMHAPGIQLPLKDGKLRAHISVARPEEIDHIADKITETGKLFSFQLGQLKEVKPLGWGGVSKVWFVEVHSPELELFRKSYGLPSLPEKNGTKLPFHITVAIRKTNVLRNNEMSKIAVAPLIAGAGRVALSVGKKALPTILRGMRSPAGKRVGSLLNTAGNVGSVAMMGASFMGGGNQPQMQQAVYSPQGIPQGQPGMLVPKIPRHFATPIKGLRYF